MDYVWILNEVFTTIIIPLLGILTIFIIKCVNAYCDKLRTQTDSELVKKYIAILNEVIITCVMATNQTYVDALKEQGTFDVEAQKKAFEMTYNAVKEILTDEMMSVLSEVYEDVDLYIKEQIEFMVKAYRIEQ